MAKQKILITGATGFVGRAVCHALIARGYEVQILLRDPLGVRKIPATLGASIIMGSLGDETSLAVACAGMDCVLHLAGMAHAGRALEQQAMDTNLGGTQNLLLAAIKANVGRLVFLSSSLAEAAANERGDITAYGKSKLLAERLLQEAARAGQIEVSILRSVNVYGPGMKGNIALMIAMIEKGRLPPLPKINNRISLVSVQDLASALILAIESTKTCKSPMAVTDGQQYSIAEVEQAIYRALGRPTPRWRMPRILVYCASLLAGLISEVTVSGGSISVRTYRNLTSDNLFSNSMEKKELGFEPSTTFYQNLPAMVRWIRDNPR